MNEVVMSQTARRMMNEGRDGGCRQTRALLLGSLLTRLRKEAQAALGGQPNCKRPTNKARRDTIGSLPRTRSPGAIRALLPTTKCETDKEAASSFGLLYWYLETAVQQNSNFDLEAKPSHECGE